MEQQMNYITGVYWQEQKQSSVVLQQVVRKDGVPILLMCIINRNDNPNSVDHSPVDQSPILFQFFPPHRKAYVPLYYSSFDMQKGKC